MFAAPLPLKPLPSDGENETLQAVSIVMFEIELLKKHWLKELHNKKTPAGPSSPGPTNSDGDGEEAASPGRHDEIGFIVEEDDSMERLQYRHGPNGAFLCEVDKRGSLEAELMLQLVIVCRHLGADERCAEELITHTA